MIPSHDSVGISGLHHHPRCLVLKEFLCTVPEIFFYLPKNNYSIVTHTLTFIHFVSLQNGFQPSFVYGECIKKIICWLFTVLWKNYNPQVGNAILISICFRIVPHSLLISFIINSNAFWKLYLLKFMAMRYWTFNGPKQVFLLRFVETNICIILSTSNCIYIYIFIYIKHCCVVVQNAYYWNIIFLK